MEEKTIDIRLVKFDPVIYPRSTQSADEIERYAELIRTGTELPPIKLDHRYRIVDGYHRWQAHLKHHLKTIRVIFVDTADDFEALQMASYLNAVQGMPLTKDDRRKNAIKLYQMACHGFAPPSEKKMKEIARAVGVSWQTLYRWTAEVRKKRKHEREKKVTELRKQGKTQGETARILGISQRTVSDVERTTPFSKNSQMRIFAREGKNNNSFGFTSRRECLAAMQELIKSDIPSCEEGIIQSKIISSYTQIKTERQRYGIDMETYRHFRQEIQKHTANILTEMDYLNNNVIGLLAQLKDMKLKLNISALFKNISDRFEEFKKHYRYVMGVPDFAESESKLDSQKKIIKIMTKMLQQKNTTGGKK